MNFFFGMAHNCDASDRQVMNKCLHNKNRFIWMPATDTARVYVSVCASEWTQTSSLLTAQMIQLWCYIYTSWHWYRFILYSFLHSFAGVCVCVCLNQFDVDFFYLVQEHTHTHVDFIIQPIDIAQTYTHTYECIHYTAIYLFGVFKGGNRLIFLKCKRNYRKNEFLCCCFPKTKTRHHFITHTHRSLICK